MFLLNSTEEIKMQNEKSSRFVVKIVSMCATTIDLKWRHSFLHARQ